MEQAVERIIASLNASKSPFHVVSNIEATLLEAGFEELDEKKEFIVKKGKSYFVKRNDSSIIAFKIPAKCEDFSFFGTATHNDSPTYKLKPNPFVRKGNLTLLDTEPYGGMIHSSWLDRPLSFAGRVYLQKGNEIEERLVDIDKDLLLIPNLAIHMNRDINNGYAYNPAIDMLPLLSSSLSEEETFSSYLSKELSLEEDEQILSHDLYLYNRDKARQFGAEEEFLSSPKIDDLASVYCALLSFLASNNEKRMTLFASFDNEEVGSLTRQGAAGTFFRDTLLRLSSAIGFDLEEAIARSFILSVDNAHANHPNHPEKSDQTTNVLLGEGIVLKHNANQSYTTDAFGAALVKQVASLARVPVQEFSNRSDIRGGSTLGNLLNGQMSIHSADIGLPELAMHSTNETMAIKDLCFMVNFLTAFFEKDIRFEGEGFQIRP